MKETELLIPRIDGKVSALEKEIYQRIIGLLIFSMIETRPNIALAILVVSRFAKNPSHLYTKVVKTIFQYLKGSKDRDIIYGGQN